MKRPGGGSGRPGVAVVGCVLVALSVLAAPVSAQFVVAPGASFESYTFSDVETVGIETIMLATAPFAVRIGQDRVRLEVAGAYAFGRVKDENGTEYELNGMTDTEARLILGVVQDHFTIVARGFLPTGTATLDEIQSVVATVVSADLLPFRISNWGTGGGFMIEAAVSQRFGSFGAGVNVGYGLAQEFEPTDGSDAIYQPGNQVSVRVALDTEFGSGAKFAVIGGIRKFEKDVYEEQDLFQSGDRYEGMASLAFPAFGGGSGVLYGGLVHREEGTSFDPLSPPGAGSKQDLILAGGVWRVPVGGGWFQPRIDARFFRSEDGRGQGRTIGVGGAFEIPLGSAAAFIPSGTARFGNIELMEGVESNFTGFQGGFTLRLGR